MYMYIYVYICIYVYIYYRYRHMSSLFFSSPLGLYRSGHDDNRSLLNTLQHTATRNTLQRTLQPTATQCCTQQRKALWREQVSFKHTASCRNTLQHTATHCNTLQHTATHCNTLLCDDNRSLLKVYFDLYRSLLYTYCTQLYAVALIDKRLKQTLDLHTLCNTLQHTAAHCNSLQHTATHCKTLQHTATCCTHLFYRHTAPHCTTLQHTATRCNTLQTARV